MLSKWENSLIWPLYSISRYLCIKNSPRPSKIDFFHRSLKRVSRVSLADKNDFEIGIEHYCTLKQEFKSFLIFSYESPKSQIRKNSDFEDTCSWTTKHLWAWKCHTSVKLARSPQIFNQIENSLIEKKVMPSQKWCFLAFKVLVQGKSMKSIFWLFMVLIDIFGYFALINRIIRPKSP